MNPEETTEEQKTLFRIGDLALVRYTESLKKTDKIVGGGLFDNFKGNDELDCAGTYIGPDIFGSKTKKKRGIVNERQAVLEEIRTIINEERKKEGKGLKRWSNINASPKVQKRIQFGPLSGRALAMKLSHIPTKDLYFLLSEGKDYKNRTGRPFSMYIFGSIKVKKQLTTKL